MARMRLALHGYEVGYLRIGACRLWLAHTGYRCGQYRVGEPLEAGRIYDGAGDTAYYRADGVPVLIRSGVHGHDRHDRDIVRTLAWGWSKRALSGAMMPMYAARYACRIERADTARLGDVVGDMRHALGMSADGRLRDLWAWAYRKSAPWDTNLDIGVYDVVVGRIEPMMVHGGKRDG